jgi:hypothetical protein
MAQEVAEPVAEAAANDGGGGLGPILALLATNALTLALFIWSGIQRTRFAAGAQKVAAVLWEGCDRAREVAEAGKAVLAYLASPTAANKAAAEREVADLRVVRGR